MIIRILRGYLTAGSDGSAIAAPTGDIASSWYTWHGALSKTTRMKPGYQCFVDSGTFPHSHRKTLNARYCEIVRACISGLYVETVQW
jgi:hypothetical protein